MVQKSASKLSPIPLMTTEQLLADPVMMIQVLEKERDRLVFENKNLREGIRDLVERADASADLMLPSIAVDIRRLTEELTRTKAMLALGTVNGESAAMMTELLARKNAVEKELASAEDLQGAALRLRPLIHEIKLRAGMPVRLHYGDEAATSVFFTGKPAVDPTCAATVFHLHSTASVHETHPGLPALLHTIKEHSHASPVPFDPDELPREDAEPAPETTDALAHPATPSPVKAVSRMDTKRGVFEHSVFSKIQFGH